MNLWYKLFPKKTAIITFSNGVEFNIVDPDYRLIRIEDIAMALSNLCRFNGLIENNYFSISEHSLNVAKCLENDGYIKNIVLAGLLHDAAEYVTGDCISPWKSYLGRRYKKIERKLEVAINKKFNIDLFKYHKVIKNFDNQMFELENLCLKKGGRHPFIRCLCPKVAREEFLEKYWELTR